MNLDQTRRIIQITERLGFSRRDLWWAAQTQVNPEEIAQEIAGDAFEADPRLDAITIAHDEGGVPKIHFRGCWSGLVEEREAGVYNGPANPFIEELVEVADELANAFAASECLITRQDWRERAQMGVRMPPREALGLAVKAFLVSNQAPGDEAFKNGFAAGAQYLMEILLPEEPEVPLRTEHRIQ